jgi:hypothetical protein
MITKILVSLSLALGLGILASPQYANAQLFQGSKDAACDGVDASSGGNCDQGKLKKAEDRVSDTIKNIVNLITILVGIIAVIMIIINGFRFITSGGDSNAVASARNGIIYALVGLVVAALAQVLVRFVLNRIL